MAVNNTLMAAAHLSANDILDLLPTIYAESGNDRLLSHSTLRHIIEKQMNWMDHQYQQQHHHPRHHYPHQHPPIEPCSSDDLRFMHDYFFSLSPPRPYAQHFASGLYAQHWITATYYIFELFSEYAPFKCAYHVQNEWVMEVFIHCSLLASDADLLCCRLVDLMLQCWGCKQFTKYKFTDNTNHKNKNKSFHLIEFKCFALLAHCLHSKQYLKSFKTTAKNNKIYIYKIIENIQLNGGKNSAQHGMQLIEWFMHKKRFISPQSQTQTQSQLQAQVTSQQAGKYQISHVDLIRIVLLRVHKLQRKQTELITQLQAHSNAGGDSGDEWRELQASRSASLQRVESGLMQLSLLLHELKQLVTQQKLLHNVSLLHDEMLLLANGPNGGSASGSKTSSLIALSEAQLIDFASVVIEIRPQCLFHASHVHLDDSGTQLCTPVQLAQKVGLFKLVSFFEDAMKTYGGGGGTGGVTATLQSESSGELRSGDTSISTTTADVAYEQMIAKPTDKNTEKEIQFQPLRLGNENGNDGVTDSQQQQQQQSQVQFQRRGKSKSTKLFVASGDRDRDGGRDRSRKHRQQQQPQQQKEEMKYRNSVNLQMAYHPPPPPPDVNVDIDGDVDGVGNNVGVRQDREQGRMAQGVTGIKREKSTPVLRTRKPVKANSNRNSATANTANVRNSATGNGNVSANVNVSESSQGFHKHAKSAHAAAIMEMEEKQHSLHQEMEHTRRQHQQLHQQQQQQQQQRRQSRVSRQSRRSSKFVIDDAGVDVDVGVEARDAAAMMFVTASAGDVDVKRRKSKSHGQNKKRRQSQKSVHSMQNAQQQRVRPPGVMDRSDRRRRTHTYGMTPIQQQPPQQQSQSQSRRGLTHRMSATLTPSYSNNNNNNQNYNFQQNAHGHANTHTNLVSSSSNLNHGHGQGHPSHAHHLQMAAECIQPLPSLQSTIHSDSTANRAVVDDVPSGNTANGGGGTRGNQHHNGMHTMIINQAEEEDTTRTAARTVAATAAASPYYVVDESPRQSQSQLLQGQGQTQKLLPLASMATHKESDLNSVDDLVIVSRPHAMMKVNGGLQQQRHRHRTLSRFDASGPLYEPQTPVTFQSQMSFNKQNEFESRIEILENENINLKSDVRKLKKAVRELTNTVQQIMNRH